MTKDEALKMALEALELWKLMQPNTLACAIRIPAITAIKETLAQPEQEPVGVIQHLDELNEQWTKHLPIGTKLYTTPPKRQPLTDQRINEIYQEATCQSLRPQDYKLARQFARSIEAAHGIKETQ